MFQLKQKLQSNKGATLVFALLFMLICVFVGGAVLTSATVNGGRIKGEYAQQQAALNQRSIVSVFLNSLSVVEESESGNKKVKMQLTAEIRTDAVSHVKTVFVPDDAQGIKKAIFTAAQRAYANRADATVNLTVTDPDGTQTECYVTCKTGSYKINIGFTQDPQVMLEIYARSGNDQINWYGGKIVKAVTEVPEE